MPGGADDLDEVVRSHIRGHTDRDAAGTVDEQVRIRSRQHIRLRQLVVIVGHEINDVFVEILSHRECGSRQAGLGVPRSRGAVVERAEVSVAVDQGNAQGERLCHPHQGVVDRGVTVRVQLAHHLADDASRLHVAAIRAQAHLTHLVEDATLHRLEAVSGIGKSTGVNHGVCVLQERPLHLCRYVDIFDALGKGCVCCAV